MWLEWGKASACGLWVRTSYAQQSLLVTRYPVLSQICSKNTLDTVAPVDGHRLQLYAIHRAGACESSWCVIIDRGGLLSGTHEAAADPASLHHARRPEE